MYVKVRWESVEVGSLRPYGPRNLSSSPHVVASLAPELSYQLELSLLQRESASVVTLCVLWTSFCVVVLFFKYLLFFIFLISIKVLYISSLNTENSRCVCIWHSRQTQEVQSQACGLEGESQPLSSLLMSTPVLQAHTPANMYSK